MRFCAAVMCGLLNMAVRAIGAESGAIVVPDTNAPVLPDSILTTTNAVGSWIWDTTTTIKQTCRFWRAFEIPHSTVARAQLRLTVDNGYRLFLDGREIGRGSDWRTLTEYDLTWVLNPGRHVMAVEAFNDRAEGGLIMGLRVELVDQRIFELASDDS